MNQEERRQRRQKDTKSAVIVCVIVVLILLVLVAGGVFLVGRLLPKEADRMKVPTEPSCRERMSRRRRK